MARSRRRSERSPRRARYGLAALAFSARSRWHVEPLPALPSFRERYVPYASLLAGEAPRRLPTIQKTVNARPRPSLARLAAFKRRCVTLTRPQESFGKGSGSGRRRSRKSIRRASIVLEKLKQNRC